ncbi:hypothetical protein GCM10009846_03910 [Agrococcus versicolor]|uniref:Tryptophan synthase n=1 Tax=Agrococcus versicolor TaxID=501482 RepID=A0ABN3AJW6_9MICO
MLQGTKSYLMQDEDGQTVDSLSISAGLDYPSDGPEHAHLASTGRVTYAPTTDDEAIEAFRLLSPTEGIIPTLESAHALAGSMKLAADMGPEALVLVNLSGRGDKDVATAARHFGLLDEDAVQL